MPSREFVSTLALCFLSASAMAQDGSDIPSDAPKDEVMASSAEVRGMQRWAEEAFGGAPVNGRPGIRVECRRQDHSVLQFGKSCIDTPLRIGRREFNHGLGTHANSEIVLHLPPGAGEFRACVGVDNNFDTGGVRGSVQFSLEAGGKELWRTETLRGTNEAVEVTQPLPPGTRELLLKVDATPDGPAYDQADWADARVLGPDGAVYWADEDAQGFLAATLPFSFRYGGQPISNLISGWHRAVERSETLSRFVQRLQWEDPRTHLRVEATAITFKRYTAVDWVLEFENAGTEDTPLLEDIQPLDEQLRSGYIRKPVRLHRLVGDVCGESSFMPMEEQVEPGAAVALAPQGGRSSNGAFPFFNVQYGDEGVIAAIGWSGQWQATLQRGATGPARLRAGMQKTSFKLHPGEKVRTPRILVMTWKGDRLTAHERFRRLMLFEYCPRQEGHPLRLPIALQCFDRYVGSQKDWGTESGQLAAAKAASTLGCDAHWLDAAWFEGGFPNGVGNWFTPRDRFPNGLKPLSDACHQMGLKLVVWFEPERVAAGTEIAREHPEFVYGGAKGGLFKLGDPAARRWLTDLLSRRIEEFGLDTYRNDFNIDPLPFWRQNDTPDQQGITEIQYVEGLYALWDELRARHPGLNIDNCASGGRRIDLETCMRSVPLWHSDTGCSPGHADWNQTQSYGLNLYVPLFTGCAWEPTAYDTRSACTAGLICQFAFLDSKFSTEAARAALAEVRTSQKYWYGDFYPLTPCTLGTGAFLAYQFHRSDLNSGLVLAFRRSECPYPALQAALHGLDPAMLYDVEFSDQSRAKTRRQLRGRALMSDFEIRLPSRGSSLLMHYEPAHSG